MLVLKNKQLRFKNWQMDVGSSNWGRMQFEVENAFFQDLHTSMLSIYQLNGRTVVDIECFILNNVSEATLFESSLESIMESVLSVINDEDIVVLNDISNDFNDDFNTDFVVEPNTSNISSDFESNSDFEDSYDYGDDEYVDEDEYYGEEDEYYDDDMSIDVAIEDVDYYDDMNYEEYDDDDDF